MLSVSRRLGAAGAAVLLATAALPNPAAAAPGEPFGFIVAQYEYRVGAVGGGGTVITPSVDGRHLENARLQVDLAGLAGVATAVAIQVVVVAGPGAGAGESWRVRGPRAPARLQDPAAATVEEAETGNGPFPGSAPDGGPQPPREQLPTANATASLVLNPTTGSGGGGLPILEVSRADGTARSPRSVDGRPGGYVPE